MGADAPLLVADCVGKWYGDRQVLSSASLRACAGQVRVVFGRNGAGKSTLFRIAAGVIAADTGTVRFEGEVLERPTLAGLARRGVFWLPDHELLSHAFTVRAHLTFLATVFSSDAVEESAAHCGVAHLLDRRPMQLSGGELRRAELAAALVRAPRCLLADEPLRGVAPADQEQIGAILRLLAARGTAVVISGHDVPVLGAIADHVTWCTSGTTCELGTPHDAARHEPFRREYLGVAAWTA